MRDQIAGVDEAGRGPLAGPVIAAAVILDPQASIEGLADSKTLSEKKRVLLCAEIQQKSLAWAMGSATVEEIDEINILQASLLAMQRAIHALPIQPTLVLVDGNRCPELAYPAEAIVKGDSKVPAISAASIIAKVMRDQIMWQLHEQYPQYGFAQHKGYPTVQHRNAIKTLGVSSQHRRSFAPVKAILTKTRQ